MPSCRHLSCHAAMSSKVPSVPYGSTSGHGMGCPFCSVKSLCKCGQASVQKVQLQPDARSSNMVLAALAAAQDTAVSWHLWAVKHSRPFCLACPV